MIVNDYMSQLKSDLRTAGPAPWLEVVQLLPNPLQVRCHTSTLAYKVSAAGSIAYRRI